jgi:glucose/arabinose dehydrogenase
MIEQIVSTKKLLHSLPCRNSAAAALILGIGLVFLAGCGLSPSKGTPTTTAGMPDVGVILSGLDNPRGVVVGPAGALFVAEAGTGYAAVDPTQMTGKLTKFTDRNGDGDFDDEGEAERWFSHLPTQMTGKLTKFTDRNGDGDFDDEGEAERRFSHLPTHNALQTFGTRRDEVSGPGDVLLHRDGRIFLTVADGPQPGRPQQYEWPGFRP